MKELLYPYIFICWLLLKTGLVKRTTANYAAMIIVGIFINVAVFFAHRFYSPVDFTDSTVVRAQSAILSPITESIDQYYVTHNQQVKKGQLLYTLVKNEEDNNLTKLDAEISSLETSINQAQDDLSRMQALADAVPLRDVAKVKSQLIEMQFDRKALQAQRQQAQFEASQLAIKAPFNGSVTRLDTAAGSRVGNLQLWNTDSKILEMRVPDQLWSRIKPGQFAEFYVDAYPGHIFRARVHSIAGATGEARGSHGSQERPVSEQLALNSRNIGRTVLLEFDDPAGITIPIGARGSAWIATEKPFAMLEPIDMLGAATLRLKAMKSFLGAF
ncbi:efflux RND transporter periplasmic adaptor subunit [Motilimonas pumila]|uniref:HlyD family efflux transporter periplasmic adaptor subunit n=1 Tax=Motilimonas pumila TaxID=2303987 RepID=A0A418Y9W1_9GAMM|nr:efflux RND transporter periplasmic adaptor subunit [Motilimonas pumila]RJG38297.1 HlyD family efflux transporter periplasmic adaptor subunit [Motilimonas pumila]